MAVDLMILQVAGRQHFTTLMPVKLYENTGYVSDFQLGNVPEPTVPAYTKALQKLRQWDSHHPHQQSPRLHHRPQTTLALHHCHELSLLLSQVMTILNQSTSLTLPFQKSRLGNRG